MPKIILWIYNKGCLFYFVELLEKSLLIPLFQTVDFFAQG